jgi:D-glycero-D-manno-heptose 1,7-bisphosphate phosphatase
LRKHNVVVLDRDGTIVVDRHYLADPDALEFETGAEAGLSKMVAMGLRLVVITNQSGVARGLLSLARLEEIHSRFEQMLHLIDVQLDAIYFCPHGPGDECECRKPRLGLMKRAAAELEFDMSQAIVIGDKSSDIEFGANAGATTMLVRKPDAPATAMRPAPTYIVENLVQAADIIGNQLD